MEYDDKGGSGSSMSDSGWSYDVFLSFAGKDTRYGFTGHLYDALCRKGIKTFMDTMIKSGDQISHALTTKIDESRIAVVVFSENYAKSTWCLDELVKIVECVKSKGQLVRSIFYHVQPSDIHHGRNSFGDALTEHEKKFSKEKVAKWRSALTQVATVSGWHFQNGYEYLFIREVTKEIYTILTSTAVHEANSPVGLESRMLEVRSLLEINSDDIVSMVGMCGIGGIGKTTIARGVYDSLADQFEAKCFLTNVRENSSQGLIYLQKVLLSEMLGDGDDNIRDVNQGMAVIKNRLKHRKILLVLDDVNELEQLQALVGGLDWFGNGSRIIITTRDKHLLTCHRIENDKILEARELNDREALELFSREAFKRFKPDASHARIYRRVIAYSKGVPLVLKIIGADLCGRSMDKWGSVLDEYERVPKRKIHDVLKISYDGLEHNDKELFLDIACFFKGSELKDVKNILRDCDFFTDIGFDKLIDKSLVSIQDKKIWMHDLIQEMGRKIVQQQSAEPNQRSRLWHYKDVHEVLTRNMGTDKIQGIFLQTPQVVEWNGEAFRKMTNLRILIIEQGKFSTGPSYIPSSLRLLHWVEYPSPRLPQDFEGKKLVVLKLLGSSIQKMPLKKCKNLTIIDFRMCHLLKEIPDVSELPNLAELHADYCASLEKVHESVGLLDKLVKLSFKGCRNITNFPHKLRSKVLESLDISHNYKITRFPNVAEVMERIRFIDVGGTSMEKLPSCFGDLVGLEVLRIRNSQFLKRIPSTFFALQNLKELDAENCPLIPKALRALRLKSISTSSASNDEAIHITMVLPNLISLNMSHCDLIDEDIPVLLSCFPRLRSLFISGNRYLSYLPACFKEFLYMGTLDIASCRKLQHIYDIPPNLWDINASDCSLLTAQSSSLLLSQGLHNIPKLQVRVRGERIPEWIKYCYRGGTLSFYVHGGKFPMCAISFITKQVGCDIEFSLSINGSKVLKGSSRLFVQESESHVVLFDMRAAFKFQQEDLDARLKQDEWNQVEICCLLIKAHAGRKRYNPEWCGVHLYEQQEQEQDLENNILFASPCHPKK